MITIRATGPDFDISAAITTNEDIEIVEWILAKIRTELKRLSEQHKPESTK